VNAEIEMRKSSDVGPPDRKTGHLKTYERHALLAEEKKTFEHLHLKQLSQMQMLQHNNATATNNAEAIARELEDSATTQDLETTKKQIHTLNRLISDIRESQERERHKLSVHATTNEHSHRRMVLSSLFETVFYILVSAFQVYTIRKWFRGSPILGF